MMMMMMMMCRKRKCTLVLKEMRKTLVFSHLFSRKFKTALKNGKNMYTDEVRRRRRRKTKSFKSGK